MEWIDRTTGEIVDLSQPDGPARALLAQQHTIEQLNERLQLLVGRVESLQTDTSDHRVDFADAVSGWSWRDLGPIGAQVLWDRLNDWVGWLRGRYPLAEQLPACWWRHPELVEELTALWLAWRAAYTDPTAVMTQPAEFHDRWLPGALHRVKQWGVHCDATHRERPASVYDARRVDDEAAFSAHLRADLDARSRPEPDQPSSPTDGERAAVTMSAAEMGEQLKTVDAVRIGSLPGSPVRLGDTYWFTDGQSWTRIDDPDVVAKLRHDGERLRQADDAVRRLREQRDDDEHPT